MRLYKTSSSYLAKTISNVDISLLRSAMGIERKSNGKIAFPAGSLELLVAFDVTSCSSCSTWGNGRHSTVVTNATTAFGTITGTGLTLDYSFPVNLAGTATLHIVASNLESPPSPSIISTTTVACNKPGGYLLDLSWSTSTDPDSDLDILHWLVDGRWTASRVILPVGAHSVRLEAIDSRGAVRRTAPKSINVTAGSSCP